MRMRVIKRIQLPILLVKIQLSPMREKSNSIGSFTYQLK